MSDIEVVEGPPAVHTELIRRRIADYLARSDVRLAILFGSHARGEADAASDVDLVLVEETTRPFVERGLEHLPLFRMGVGLDLLVYTPAEWARLKADGNPLVARIEREGIIVHARP